MFSKSGADIRCHCIEVFSDAVSLPCNAVIESHCVTEYGHAVEQVFEGCRCSPTKLTINPKNAPTDHFCITYASALRMYNLDRTLWLEVGFSHEVFFDVIFLFVSITTRIHVDRVAGGNCNHRRSDRAFAPRCPTGTRSGSSDSMQKQPQAIRCCVAQLP